MSLGNRFHNRLFGIKLAISKSMSNPSKNFRDVFVFNTPLFPLVFLTLALVTNGCNKPHSKPFTQFESGVPQGQWIPESEHTCPYRVIGLDPHRSSYFMLPEIHSPAGADPAALQTVEEQLYWLNFRFSHGDILDCAPQSQWYVAVPDSASVTDSLGNELEFFKSYIRHFCKTSDQDFQNRFFPFLSSSPLIWTQDIGELVIQSSIPGADIYCGPQDQKTYLDVAHGLTRTYPDSFRYHPLPSNLSAEGGDLEVVWGPNRKPAILLGRHRVLRYLENTRPGWDHRRAVPQALIEEARKAYSEAFGHLPVIIVTERALREPEKASEEMFHLDMLASIMDNHQGPHPHAFVPIFSSPKVVDAMSGKSLPESLTRKVEWEFDEAARQLAALGYQVVRLPFNDHPARSPVNFGKSKNAETGRYSIYLAKYPYHLPQGNPQTPQARLMAAVSSVQDWGARWNGSGNASDLASFHQSLSQLWQAMTDADAAFNPLYEERAKRIREAGYDVVEVHCYAWGSGGIHCQTLR
jgi:hypothetical protein